MTDTERIQVVGFPTQTRQALDRIARHNDYHQNGEPTSRSALIRHICGEFVTNHPTTKDQK